MKLPCGRTVTPVNVDSVGDGREAAHGLLPCSEVSEVAVPASATVAAG